jgi:hypothetical protein
VVIELWDKKGGLKYGSKGLSLSKIIITEKKRKVYGGRWCPVAEPGMFESLGTILTASKNFPF